MQNSFSYFLILIYDYMVLKSVFIYYKEKLIYLLRNHWSSEKFYSHQNAFIIVLLHVSANALI